MSRRGHDPINFSKIVRFWEILVLHRKIFVFLLLVKIRVLNFIGISLNLPPLLYRCHDAPGACASCNVVIIYIY